MRRRAVLGAAGTLTAGLAGCLTSLGVTERGLVRSKFVRVETDQGPDRIVIDSIAGERVIAERHREDVPAEGPLIVSKPVHDALTGRYSSVDYGIRHDCSPETQGETGGCGLTTLSRGDFNSLRVGDTAELLYRGSGATVVGVSRPQSTPGETPTPDSRTDTTTTGA